MSVWTGRGIWGGVVVLALVTGWAIGRSGSTQPPGNGSRPRPIRSEVPTSVPPQDAADHDHAAEGGRADALPLPALNDADEERILQVLKETLRASGGRLERAQSTLNRVVEMLGRRSDLRASFLRRFREESDSDLLYVMMQVLMDVRGTDVVPTMMAQARDLRADSPHRRAALGVLDGQNDWSALSDLGELIRTERDPEILSAAIHALPEGGAVNSLEARTTALLLSHVLERGAPEYESAREAAALVFGQWASDAADRDRLLRTLRDDPSPKVRMAAAFGMILAAEKDPGTLAALADIVRNGSEDTTVRTNAWRALGAARVLPDEYVAVYRTFEKEQAR